MREIMLVIKHEIQVTLSKRTYWVLTFLLPIFILGATLVPTLIAGNELEEDPLTAAQRLPQTIGIDDLAGVIEEMPPNLAPAAYRLYDDGATAEAALQSGAIEQLVIIPADFLRSGQVLVRSKGSSSLAGLVSDRLINYLIAYNLASDPVLAAAIVDPVPQAEEIALAAPAEQPRGESEMLYFVTFIMMFLLFFVISITGGFMLQSVAKEKENRTVEVLLLSINPRQLMAGKVLGLGLVALLQMVIWLLGARTALQRSSSLLNLPSDFTLPASFLAITLAFFVLAYFLYAALLAALGALAPNVREGTQFTFMILVPLLVPLWLNRLFISDPQGGAATVLSLFPLTAPTAMVARMGMVAVPAWQIGISLLGLLLATIFFVRLAARFFRADVLLDSGSLSWSRLRQEVRKVLRRA